MAASEPTREPPRVWHDAAVAATRAEPNRLSAFLDEDPDCPTREDHFLTLLKLVLDLDDKAKIELVYDKLNRVAIPEPRARNIDPLIEESFREAARNNPNPPHGVSLYQLFRLSLKDAEKSQDYSVPLMIWTRWEEKLWNKGALYACAEYDARQVMFLVLETVREKLPVLDEEDRARLRRTLFQPGPRAYFTPLGIAIYKGNAKIVEKIADMLKGCNLTSSDGSHLFMDPNLVTQNTIPILHFALQAAAITAAMELVESRKGPSRRGTGIDAPVVPVTSRALEKAKDTIKVIIELCPATLCVHDTEVYPSLPPIKIAKAISKRFGDESLEIFIRESIFRELEGYDDVRQALYSDGDPVFEFALDLSDFNYDSHSFEDFVAELHDFHDSTLGKKWEFEDTLLYLVLPDLRRLRESESRTVLLRFRDWLHKIKVKKIIELVLPDNPQNPLDEEFIERELIEKFNVESLDWRKLDMDLRPIVQSKSRGDSLRKLRLYSSGNWGPLYQWASVDPEIDGQGGSSIVESAYGLATLKNLKTVDICFVQPKRFETDDSGLVDYRKKISNYETDINTMLEGSNFSCNTETGYLWNAFVTKSRPDDKEPRTWQTSLTKSLRSCHDFLGDLCDPESLSSKLATFRKSRNELNNRPIRIAIIDNGTDQMRSTISENIEMGWSFTRPSVAGKKILPWYTAADPHGTQMAYLIRNVNPYCRLIPIRVGLYRKDIDPKLAAKAIDWAVAKEVDIISISWSVEEKVPELIDAVSRAASQCLIFCSTADKGAHASSEIYPADCPHVIKVSASDSLYLPRPQSQREVDIMIDGDEIVAQGPKYMLAVAEGRISGSSVATALAAGLASLCMLLGRMASDPDKADCFRRKPVMMGLLGCMKDPLSDPTQNKIIVPRLLFEEGWGPWTVSDDTTTTTTATNNYPGFGLNQQERQEQQLQLPEALERFNYKHFARMDNAQLVVTLTPRRQSPNTAAAAANAAAAAGFRRGRSTTVPHPLRLDRYSERSRSPRLS